MLKLNHQYGGHLMRRADSLEKTLMLEKTEGKRRRGRQRMRWLVRQHHWLSGHAFEQTPGDSEGQGSLGLYSPCGLKRWTHPGNWTTSEKTGGCPTLLFHSSCILSLSSGHSGLFSQGPKHGTLTFTLPYLCSLYWDHFSSISVNLPNPIHSSWFCSYSIYSMTHGIHNDFFLERTLLFIHSLIHSSIFTMDLHVSITQLNI